MRLILGSRSARRADLLSGLGFSFEVLPADIDESYRSGESPKEYVARIASSKAERVSQKLIEGLPALPHETTATTDRSVAGHSSVAGCASGYVVLCADTVVDFEGKALTKPDDDQQAREMLMSMSGRTHYVHSAISVNRVDADGTLSYKYGTADSACVKFRELSDSLLDWYLGFGEHLDKAGAYALQGLGVCFVDSLEGNPSTVEGLPVPQTLHLLNQCGFFPVEFAEPADNDKSASKNL